MEKRDYRFWSYRNVKEQICVSHYVVIDDDRGADNLIHPITRLVAERLIYGIPTGEEKDYGIGSKLTCKEAAIDFAKEIGVYDKVKRYLEWAEDKEGLHFDFVPIVDDPLQIQWYNWYEEDRREEWGRATAADFRASRQDRMYGLR